MKTIKLVYLITMAALFCIYLNSADQAELVHNSLEEIEACNGKLRLESVRIWGGDEEEDENKFFKTPISVAVDKKAGLVYICDEHSHWVRVFKESGEYVRTISQRGRGPGDSYLPGTITISPGGDLLVLEPSGFRIQRFSPEGKSKQIIKFDRDVLRWVGVTSKDELVVYNPAQTIRTGKLLSILDHRGKTVKEIGTYHDKSKNTLESEKLFFSIDNGDNFHAANTCTPVIRKYSPEGTLSLAVTYDVLYEIPPVEISLNSNGDEIKIIREDENTDTVRDKRGKTGSMIQRIKGKGKPKLGVCWAFGTDSRKRIYIVCRRRFLTEKEKRAAYILWNNNKIIRENVDYDIVDKINDINRLVVFNPEGKVIAEAKLPTFCDGIYISEDRLFIVDGYFYQRILEYKMHFEK